MWAAGDQRSLACNSTSSFYKTENLRLPCRSQAAQQSKPATTRLAVAAAVPKHQQQQAVVHVEQGSQSTQQLDAGLEAFQSLIAEKRFFCTQCGKCCTGDGEVWIGDEEAVRIAAFLGIPLQRFYQQYTRAYSKVEGFKLLKAKLNPERDCIFLQPNNTCSIHKVRPLQCSTYPWWPDLMNEQDWTWEKENVCEGFDHAEAPETDLTDAARQLKAATAMEYKRMLSRKPSKRQQKAAKAAAAAALSGLQLHNAGDQGAVQRQQQQQQQQQQGAVGAAAAQQSSSQSSSASVSSHTGSDPAASRCGTSHGIKQDYSSARHMVAPNSEQPDSSSRQQLKPPQPPQQHSALGQPAADAPGHQLGGQAAAGQQQWQERLARLQKLANSDPEHDADL